MNAGDELSPQAAERFDRPRNYGPLLHWDGHARITGPCGDTMEFWVQITGERIRRVTFITDGCGGSRAAGSMASELAAGRSVNEVLQIEQADILRALGGLPARSEHCALLAASTLKAAVRDYQNRVTQRCDRCSAGEGSSMGRWAEEVEEESLKRRALTQQARPEDRPV